MIIAGAGGFARETLELLLQNEYAGPIYFYDDIDPAHTVIHDRYQVLKSVDAVKEIFLTDPSFCIGVGVAAHRRKFFDLFKSLGGSPQTIISPFAVLGKHAIEIGEGTIIATGTVITNSVRIGTGTLINLNCTVGHDSAIGEFSELSPGVHISGNCQIGSNCSIGTGAVLLPGVEIGTEVVIGAGSVVTKNVSAGTTVVGVPARPIQKK